MQLNSSKFLSDSNVAKFNATLFSSASSHASRGLDVEEAMDIDHQESNDEACVGEGNASVLPDTNVSCQPRVSEEKSLPEKYPLRGESDSSATSGAKSKELKREMQDTNQKKAEVNEQKPQILKTTSTTLSNKKRAIYIVVHVSTIQIGELIGKASAPVKIYAEKMFIEMETNEGVGNQTISHHFRIPCKDLTECKANFGGAPLLFVVKPTPAGATAIQEKCKEKGRFLDPESQDMKKRYIVSGDELQSGTKRYQS
ncbi:hypothetical protein OS493_006941 [Desmophyllum pertusum]|uniref:Uncharacterized protein n=1 Tax=Desmophyllum pertusum TaxID=174260 RepID=A0A9X0D4E2_9CNID|nr:hypothetical protein OS493_006941 [Desmophyllum pertusum]